MPRFIRYRGQMMGILRDLSAFERPKSYQLVGEVTAHQGIDGYRD